MLPSPVACLQGVRGFRTQRTQDTYWAAFRVATLPLPVTLIFALGTKRWTGGCASAEEEGKRREVRGLPLPGLPLFWTSVISRTFPSSSGTLREPVRGEGPTFSSSRQSSQSEEPKEKNRFLALLGISPCPFFPPRSISPLYIRMVIGNGKGEFSVWGRSVFSLAGGDTSRREERKPWINCTPRASSQHPGILGRFRGETGLV